MNAWELLDAETGCVGRSCCFICANSHPALARRDPCHRFGKNPPINVSQSFFWRTLLDVMFSTVQSFRFPESITLGLPCCQSGVGQLFFLTSPSRVRCGTWVLNFCWVYLWSFLLAGYSPFVVSTAMRSEVLKTFLKAEVCAWRMWALLFVC